MRVKPNTKPTQRVTPQVKDLKRMINDMPAKAMPEILVCILRNCIKHNTFKGRRVADIVHALESRIKMGVRSTLLASQPPSNGDKAR